MEIKMNDASTLNFYLDDEGRDVAVCWIDLQGGISPETQLYPSSLSGDEIELVEALLVVHPDRIRRLLNHIAEDAYALGREHGREEADFSDGIIGNLHVSMPQPGAFARAMKAMLAEGSGEANGDPVNPVVSQEVASRMAQFQAIENEILKHEPGSGSAFLDLPGSRSVGPEENSYRSNLTGAIKGIDDIKIVAVVGLSKEP
jgi:hypothetical protein